MAEETKPIAKRHRARPLPPLDILRSLLAYDPETGVFVWKFPPNRHTRIGSIAGTTNSVGYRVISILGKLYLAHRLAWLMHYGVDPSSDVDHKDRDRTNCKISNLRLVSIGDNHRNCGPRSHSKYGVKGAEAHRDGGYTARITINRKKIYLGYFKTAEGAAAAYQDALLKMRKVQ